MIAVPLGHEPAGEIVEVGADVTGLKVGDHVVVNPQAAPSGIIDSSHEDVTARLLGPGQQRAMLAAAPATGGLKASGGVSGRRRCGRGSSGQVVGRQLGRGGRCPP
jgi:hypothetical protein